MSTHDPLVSVADIKRNLDLVLEFTKGLSYQDFHKDIQRQYAAIRCFEIIGEAAKRVPEDYRLAHPQFPWKSMTAMRDKLIHGYDTVDSSVVWQTIKSDVPTALAQIRSIIE
jgi:hypothetical protein